MQPDATVVKHALEVGGVSSSQVEASKLGLVCTVAPTDAVDAVAALKQGEAVAESQPPADKAQTQSAK